MTVPTGFYLFNTVSSTGIPELDAETESTLNTFPDVGLMAENGSQGIGTVYITSRRLVWVSKDEVSKAFSVPFSAIVMHAISADPDSEQRPCIYAQVEADPSQIPDQTLESDGDEDDQAPGGGYLDDEEMVSVDMRLVPVDGSILDRLFAAMCEAAALNPDGDEEDGAGGQDEPFFFNREEALAGADPDVLAHYDALLQDGAELQQLVGADPDRFEDPDEDEDGEEGQEAPATNGHVH